VSLESLGDGTRFFCIEPMLEPVRLALDGIAWVIVGGESGPCARYMPAEWARGVRDQCKAAGVPLLIKQMCRREAIPTDLTIREFPTEGAA
jgi:protein gp37